MESTAGRDELAKTVRVHRVDRKIDRYCAKDVIGTLVPKSSKPAAASRDLGVPRRRNKFSCNEFRKEGLPTWSYYSGSVDEEN